MFKRRKNKKKKVAPCGVWTHPVSKQLTVILAYLNTFQCEDNALGVNYLNIALTKIVKSWPAFTCQTTVEFQLNLQEWLIPLYLVVHVAGTFRFAAHNGHQSKKLIKMKNLVRLSQVKLLVRFQSNFTGVISSILSCAYRQHVLLRCTK
jgi:hypothetical protein